MAIVSRAEGCRSPVHRRIFRWGDVVRYRRRGPPLRRASLAAVHHRRRAAQRPGQRVAGGGRWNGLRRFGHGNKSFRPRQVALRFSSRQRFLLAYRSDPGSLGRIAVGSYRLGSVEVGRGRCHPVHQQRHGPRSTETCALCQHLHCTGRGNTRTTVGRRCGDPGGQGGIHGGILRWFTDGSVGGRSGRTWGQGWGSSGGRSLPVSTAPSHNYPTSYCRVPRGPR